MGGICVRALEVGQWQRAEGLRLPLSPAAYQCLPRASEPGGT
jgi:hypothetical protein